MPDLRLTSRTRTERLSNDETVKLGRLLTHALPAVHVWFPEDTETVCVVARDQTSALAPGLRPLVTAFLGDFDESIE